MNNDHIKRHRAEMNARIYNIYSQSNENLQKGNEDELEKGGEGSRGGKVVGHTASGKAIYASGKFSANEHNFDKHAKKHIHGYLSHLGVKVEDNKNGTTTLHHKDGEKTEIYHDGEEDVQDSMDKYKQVAAKHGGTINHTTDEDEDDEDEVKHNVSYGKESK